MARVFVTACSLRDRTVPWPKLGGKAKGGNEIEPG